MRAIHIAILAATLGGVGRPAVAQDTPPPIPRAVLDLHGVIPLFGTDPTLAASRGVNPSELPGVGLGVDLAAHVYPFRWRAVVVGLGGRFLTSRGHRTPDEVQGLPSGLRPVTERFTNLGPQLSLNFGHGDGWSYLSAGVSASRRSIVPDGSDSLPPDDQRLRTVDYGGGARWFIKPHLAFSFDVRFYAMDSSTPAPGLPGGPRTRLLVVGAGVSVK